MALADGHVFSLVNMNSEDENYLPLWRLGDLLRLPQEKILEWIREGKFPKPLKVRKKYTDPSSGKLKSRSVKRWHVDDVLNWKEQMRIDAASDKAAKYYDF